MGTTGRSGACCEGSDRPGKGSNGRQANLDSADRYATQGALCADPSRRSAAPRAGAPPPRPLAVQARAGADASGADAIFPVGISLPRSIGAADFSLTHAPVETGCRVLAAWRHSFVR